MLTLTAMMILYSILFGIYLFKQKQLDVFNYDATFARIIWVICVFLSIAIIIVLILHYLP
jgi:hypothetical protein